MRSLALVSERVVRGGVAVLMLVLSGGCEAFSTPEATPDAGSEAGADALVAPACVDIDACVGRCGERVDACGRTRQCSEEDGVACGPAELCGAASANRCGCAAGAFDVVISRFVHRDSPASVSHCYAVGATAKNGTSADCPSFVSDGPLLALTSRRLAPDLAAVFRCRVSGATGLATYGLSLDAGAGCVLVGYAAPASRSPCGAAPVYRRRHRFHESQLLSFDRFEGDGNSDYAASPATIAWSAWAP